MKLKSKCGKFPGMDTMSDKDVSTDSGELKHHFVHKEKNDWVRGFLAGVAFCETNVYDKPLEMQQRAQEYHENVPMLLDDVWVPAGLGYDQGWITPLDYESSLHTEIN